MKHLFALFKRPDPSRPQPGFQFLQESIAYSALLAAWDEGRTPPSFTEFLAQQRQDSSPASRIQPAQAEGRRKQMKQNPGRREAELIPGLPTLAPSTTLS
jgi:hypothetical protein